MKQIMTISAALLFLTIGEVQAQNGIEQVLKNIETNNKELSYPGQIKVNVIRESRAVDYAK